MSEALPEFPVQFYPTETYPCSYLPNRQARSLVAAPANQVDTRVYSQLLQLGFRRSALFVYRPECDECRACIPVRVPVAAFSPDRSQLRAAKHHANLSIRVLGLAHVDEHFQLYRRYQSVRHPGGGMDQDDRDQYENFILKSNVASFLAEFREDGVLRMVSLIDQTGDGLSSAYTFYEPDLPGASLGTANILWQIGLARQIGLPYVYLGYWIEECRKMAYKIRFKPLEGLVDGVWQPLPASQTR